MRTYPAKLFLFGEHVLLRGATALAVPVPAFRGRWQWRTEKAPLLLQAPLANFADYLRNIPEINAESFAIDVAEGRYFASNIKTGYGLGSSAALCAGVYDCYGRDKTDDPIVLKALFGAMESFFHGKSSGIDPLTSYLNCPILIEKTDQAKKATLKKWPAAEQPCIFLIDTGRERQTGPLVQWFLEQSARPEFAALLEAELMPYHEAVIKAWLQADADAFWKNIKKVSRFQALHMHPMRTENTARLWDESAERDDIAIKICGAGGGGFLLGFAREAGTAAGWATERGFTPLFPFETQQPPS